MAASGPTLTHVQATQKIIQAIKAEQEQILKEQKAADQELAAELTKAETRGLQLAALWFLVNLLVFRPIFAWVNTKVFQRWNCFDAAKEAPERWTLNKTGLEVIVASPNDWHTISMQVALEKLGLRTYKTAESMFYMHQLLEREVQVDEVARALQACQVRAFMPHPWFDMIPGLIAASPGAKVILSTRDWSQWKAQMSSEADRAPLGILPHSYASLTASFFLCHWLPYAPLWPSTDFGHSFINGQMTTLLFQHCNFLPLSLTPLFADRSKELSGTKALHRMQQNRTIFYEYLEDIKRLVPPNQMLEFDIRRDGWAELADFLERPAPTGGSKRHEDVILPEVSLNSCSPEWAELELFPWTAFNFWAIMVASMLANWFGFMLICRLAWRAWLRARAKKRD